MESQRLANILFATSEFLATPFEREFKPHAVIEFARNHYVIPVTCVVFYLLFCYFGTKFMESRKPFGLKYPLAIWNAFLCTFSFIGMWRTVPYLLGMLLTTSYQNTVCAVDAIDGWGSGPSGMWVTLFVLSKIPELIDSVFIIIRKRPLIFLHWYHHITVLLFCWNAYATLASSGLYFVAMNYTVHALMYGYYCLQTLHMVPKSFPAILITMAQIAQMFVGTFVCASCWYYMLAGRECSNEMSNLTAGGLMYGSYLYLFVDFAVGRYAKPSKGVKKVV